MGLTNMSFVEEILCHHHCLLCCKTETKIVTDLSKLALPVFKSFRSCGGGAAGVMVVMVVVTVDFIDHHFVDHH